MSEALFGLIGVFVGSMLGVARDWWVEKRTRAKHARYLAARVVCVLDEYVECCVPVVYDNGVPNPEGRFLPIETAPEPISLPDDVDWKSINHDLMFRVLSLPNQALAAERRIGMMYEIDGPPDYSDTFEQRQFEYSELGVSASQIASELRNRYGLPEEGDAQLASYDAMLGAKRGIEQIRQMRRDG